MNAELITFETKCIDFMRFLSISINLLGVLESSGQTVFKTVPGFAFRATFEGDIEGFRPLKVLLATTVYGRRKCQHSPQKKR